MKKLKTLSARQIKWLIKYHYFKFEWITIMPWITWFVFCLACFAMCYLILEGMLLQIHHLSTLPFNHNNMLIIAMGLLLIFGLCWLVTAIMCGFMLFIKCIINNVSEILAFSGLNHYCISKDSAILISICKEDLIRSHRSWRKIIWRHEIFLFFFNQQQRLQVITSDFNLFSLNKECIISLNKIENNSQNIVRIQINQTKKEDEK